MRESEKYLYDCLVAMLEETKIVEKTHTGYFHASSVSKTIINILDEYEKIKEVQEEHE